MAVIGTGIHLDTCGSANCMRSCGWESLFAGHGSYLQSNVRGNVKVSIARTTAKLCGFTFVDFLNLESRCGVPEWWIALESIPPVVHIEHFAMRKENIREFASAAGVMVALNHRLTL